MTKDIIIWPPHEVFYLESMATITRTATAQVMGLFRQLNEIDNERPFNENAVIDHVQNIIIAAGALSRYFWPSSKSVIHSKRGEVLCTAFKIDNNSVLKDRKVRNFVEHFDENLDKFLRSFPVGTFLPSYVGFRPDEEQLAPTFFRAFFHDEDIFCVLNQEYELMPIIKEIEKLHITLDHCLNNGGRLPN